MKKEKHIHFVELDCIYLKSVSSAKLYAKRIPVPAAWKSLCV